MLQWSNSSISGTEGCEPSSMSNWLLILQLVWAAIVRTHPELQHCFGFLPGQVLCYFNMVLDTACIRVLASLPDHLSCTASRKLSLRLLPLSDLDKTSQELWIRHDDGPLVSMGNPVNNLQIEHAKWHDDVWANPPAVFVILPTTDINSESVTFLSYSYASTLFQAR